MVNLEISGPRNVWCDTFVQILVDPYILGRISIKTPYAAFWNLNII